MTAGEVVLLVLGGGLVAIGLALLFHRRGARRGLTRWEGQASRSSSLLNVERVEAIEATRDTPGGRLVDRARIVFFGVWLILAGAVAIATAVT